MKTEYLGAFLEAKQLLGNARLAANKAALLTQEGSELIEGVVQQMLDEAPEQTVPGPGAAQLTVPDGMSSYELAKQLNVLLADGHEEVVVLGDTKIPALRVGKDIHLEHGQRLFVIGGDSLTRLHGLELHPTAVGEVILDSLAVQPMHKHDKSPVRCIDECSMVHLKTHNVEIRSPYDGYDGFGMMWGMVLIGTKFTATGYLTVGPCKEHGMYTMNMRHVDIASLVNWETLRGPGLRVGCGRTLFTHQNRHPSATIGAIAGKASQGVILLRKSLARYCGHEGLLQGQAPSGGSDITIGGHTGTKVEIRDHASVGPHCGVVAVWQEAHGSSVNAANKEGVRCWQTEGSGNPWDGLSHGVSRLILGELLIRREAIPEGRTPLLISGVHTVHIPSGPLDPDLVRYDHQPGVPPITKITH